MDAIVTNPARRCLSFLNENRGRGGSLGGPDRLPSVRSKRPPTATPVSAAPAGPTPAARLAEAAHSCDSAASTVCMRPIERSSASLCPGVAGRATAARFSRLP